MNIQKFFLFHVFLIMTLLSVVSVSLKAQSMKFLRPQQVKVQGVLGAAIDSNTKGRIATLPGRDKGHILEIFKEELQKKDTSGTSWQGEMLGKWLYTAARAANRTQDTALQRLVTEVADDVVATQGADGYLGTYSPPFRMNSLTRTNQDKSWDVWVQAYQLSGLLEVNHYFPHQKYVTAARRMTDLLMNSYSESGQDIVLHGYCYGVHAIIILDPLVELYQVTHDPRYLRFAEYIIKKISLHENLNFINANLDPKADLSQMGQGKVYGLIWSFTSVLKLYQEETGQKEYITSMEHAWANIRENYLTIGGGPAGGPHTLWNECFTRPGVWQPDAMVETCSSFAWIQLNRELLQITGQAKYAEELEKTFYNQLLAASFSDGEGWAYFSMPNGIRHRTGTFMCCSASGSAALEEIAPLLYGKKKGGIAVNCYSPSEATIELQKGNTVRINQKTEYPFGSVVKIGMDIQSAVDFPLFLRKPVWASTVHLKINGIPVSSPRQDSGYLVLQRTWAKGDTVEIKLGCPIELHSKEYANQSWVAITRGPLVYATSSQVKTLPSEKCSREAFHLTDAPSGSHGPAIEWVRAEGGGNVPFLPFYEAGGYANDSTKHFVWFSVQKK
jgi:hypothetical protein